MSKRELENLINTLQQFIQHARTSGDAFEYFRLWEEVRLAEAALANSQNQTTLATSKPGLLALA